eukprot:scaffold302083_cov10-Tisochrysis_lutea.AAC.1
MAQRTWEAMLPTSKGFATYSFLACTSSCVQGGHCSCGLALQEGNRWSPEDYLMYLPAAHVHFGPQKPKINEPPAARPAGVRSLAETSLCADSAAG